MTTILLTTDIEDPADLLNIEAAVKYFLSQINPAVAVTTTPTHGAEIVHITDLNRHAGASGYHVSVNGVPTAYCSPEAAYRLWGYYNSGIIPGITRNGKVIYPTRQVHEPLYTPGLITVICHEIAEMLADGNVKTLTAPDSKGRQWLLEPCDWVFGKFLVHTINGNVCIFPDVALDSYSKVNGLPPYDLLGVIKKPFELNPPAYAYYETPAGLKPVEN